MSCEAFSSYNVVHYVYACSQVRVYVCVIIQQHLGEKRFCLYTTLPGTDGVWLLTGFTSSKTKKEKKTTVHIVYHNRLFQYL